MEASFWQQRWERGEIGFHEKDTNPFLLKYLGHLNLAKGSRIFLPLCGKTRDIAWLLANGYRVAGAELSELAITQLFDELGVKPDITNAGELKRYSATGIDIFVGDIFALSAELLETVSATYDRAALVALPPEMRKRYAAHLMNITALAPQLLITFTYNQQLMDGPPFSLSAEEVRQHYATSYNLLPAESQDVAKLRGEVAATETAWILTKP
ncbi:MAG: thiopurine S-methyltransferase [Pseudomonadota bacterium]